MSISTNFEFCVLFVPQSAVAWSMSMSGFTTIVRGSDTLRKAYIASCECIQSLELSHLAKLKFCNSP